MHQPKGFEVVGKEEHVCLLDKSLYGLKNSMLDDFMIYHEYIRSACDSYVYFKKLQSNLFIYLQLYNDNMLVSYKHMSNINKLKTLLGSEFKMKDVGKVNKILGV